MRRCASAKNKFEVFEPIRKVLKEAKTACSYSELDVVYKKLIDAFNAVLQGVSLESPP